MCSLLKCIHLLKFNHLLDWEGNQNPHSTPNNFHNYNFHNNFHNNSVPITKLETNFCLIHNCYTYETIPHLNQIVMWSWNSEVPNKPTYQYVRTKVNISHPKPTLDLNPTPRNLVRQDQNDYEDAQHLKTSHRWCDLRCIVILSDLANEGNHLKLPIFTINKNEINAYSVGFSCIYLTLGLQLC